MASNRRFLFAILSVGALCVAATSSFALTLGRANGTVTLGQALKLTVPVQMEAGEDEGHLCFQADVFYGDTRQDASRVVVSSARPSQSQSVNVLVSASSAVDEPVVTVYVRAGCEGKTSRRYVLLSELAPTAPSQLPQSDAAPVPVAPKQPKVVPMARLRAPSAVDQSAPKILKAPRRRAHLQLTPLDMPQEFEPAWKQSDQLTLEASEDVQKRAHAVALWRALNATAQDIVEQESRQQALKLDLKNLQDITNKNRQLLQDMTVRLDQAESGRYVNLLVYGLLVALAAIGVAIAFLWNRARPGGLASEPWWRDEVVADKSELLDSTHGADVTSHTVEHVESTQAPVAQSLPPLQAAPLPLQEFADLAIDLHLDDLENPVQLVPETRTVRRDPVRATPKQEPSRSVGHLDFGSSQSATLLRSINSKEMLDVSQQAEFFMTLGQHDAAIALLQDHLDDDANANPLVYLELLKILHTLGLKSAYDHYRHAFNATFNGQLPVYADFNQVGSGLEAYPDVCQQIVARWPSAEAISYIENCLLRTRMERGGQEFDLEAFRDLLMLHAVASHLASVSFDSGYVAFSAVKTTPVPSTDAPQVRVDFDLSESHDGNLIDFDVSDWSPPPSSGIKGQPN